MKALKQKFPKGLLLLLLILPQLSLAQGLKPISLEDIFLRGTFSQKSVYGIDWMKDGQYYTALEQNSSKTADNLVKYDIATGNSVAVLVDGQSLVPNGASKNIRIDDYSFSADESKVLLATKKKGIYRRSYTAEYYVYDLNTKKLNPLSKGGGQGYATFSPDGTKVAFVRNNDLYYVVLDDMKEVQVTRTGRKNEIINGSTDWVYEEEFAFVKAFFWSPDSKKIAYYTFDEREVPEFTMQYWSKSLYPYNYKFKYPKAGEKNSIIDISVYHLDNFKNVKVDIGTETDIYIPLIQWTKDPEELSLVRMNRFQNKLEILHADAETGSSKVILTEQNDTYVDIGYNYTFHYLEDGKSFIMTSEEDGFKHIFHYSTSGSLIRQITTGDWEVTEFLGLDEKKKLLYYLSTEDSPIERQLYVVKLNGKGKKKLTSQKGWHSVNISNDFKYYIQYYSNAQSPLVVSLHKAPSGDLVKVLEQNQKLKDKVKGYAMASKEFFTLKRPDKAGNGEMETQGYILKPHDFDPNKEYPVLMFVYGGPGSQQVKNQWSSSGQFMWFHYLTTQGYIVACLDNRGTGAAGKDFRHITYGIMGKYEVEDQIACAEFLAEKPFIDGERIGIFGWSYGGYMSSLALFLGPDVFKTAIAVAPVSTWRLYDTVYTERYLKTPQANGEGYDAYSPLTHADKLEGNYFAHSRFGR